MRIIERTLRPAPEAFRSPGGWAIAVEGSAFEERLDRLLGDTFWDFTNDPSVSYNPTTSTVVCSYDVPLVLPIRGAANG